MATEQIIIEYIAQVEGMKAQLKTVETALKNVEGKAGESAKGAAQHYANAGQEIKKVGKEILATLGLAFGVEKVIEFGKESIKAFAEAEVNANRLKFAVVKIGGEGSAAFEKLIKQSEKLQEQSIFSDDDIQKAQTQLSQLGLTSKQIEKLIPQTIDLASATGQTLGEATNQVIQGINGQTRGLKTLGITYEDTGSKTKNLAILTDKLTKFQGGAADALLTTAGKTARFANEIDNLKEVVGEYLVGAGDQLLDNFSLMFGAATNASIGIKRALEANLKINQIGNAKILEEAGKSETSRTKLLAESSTKIVEFNKAVQHSTSTANFEYNKQQLANEQKLNDELRNLNKAGEKIRNDATLKGMSDAQAIRDKANQERKDAEKNLLDFDKKTNDDLLDSEATTDLQKLELVRDQALAELEIKIKSAQDAKVAEDIIANSRNVDSLAIFQKFDNDKAELDKKNNDKEFEDAIKQAEALGDAESKIIAENQKKAMDQFKKDEEEKKKVREAGLQFISTALSSLNEMSHQKNDAEIQGIHEVKDTQILALDDQLKKKVITQEQYDKKKKAIESKAQEEERKIKLKQFESDKSAAVIQAVIATAVGIAKALPNPFLVALAAATGAIQIAVIGSQPTPKFAKGVVGLKGKGTGTSDEIHAMLSANESVITSEATNRNSSLLKAMNMGKESKFIHDFYIAPALKMQKKKYDLDKESAFANSLIKSISMNKLNDGNLLESLKMIRKNDKEIAHFIVKELKNNNSPNPRNW